MRKLSHALLFTALAGSLFAGSALAGDADFTLVNRTGYDIREVYVSPSHKNAWGKDRMGDNVLENGKRRLFKFSDKSSCKQDMKVVFDDDGGAVALVGDLYHGPLVDLMPHGPIVPEPDSGSGVPRYCGGDDPARTGPGT